MSSHPPAPPDRLPVLLADSARSTRVSAAVWTIAGGLAMYGMALAIAEEMSSYPGGAVPLARSVAVGAEAMRAFRWPAERLDTLGGYLTYHNVVLINVLLAVYGAIQGVRAVRGGEERHAVEELLATGLSRTGLVGGRALGFATTSLVIALGLGLGTAAGLAGGDEPDLSGALVTAGVTGLVTFVGFTLGLAVSQVVSGPRTAAGLSALVLVALYVVTNLGEQIGPLAALRFLGPFHYANQSRAMVPGHGFDPGATAVLVAMSVALLWMSTVAFERRDYAAALWPRRTVRRPVRRHPGRVPSAFLGAVWTATLRRGAVGLLVWLASAVVLTGTFAFLHSSVIDLWSRLDYLTALSGGGTATAVEDTYWGFTGEMVVPLLAAFVVTQASHWIGDLLQGRVEMVLAGPCSWARLVVERWFAAVVAVVLVSAAAVTTLWVGGRAVGGSVDPAGLGRLATMCVLFGAALAGVAAAVVAWVRRPAAVSLLAALVAASYLLTTFVALFDWPAWLNRLSVFWAFGHPYLEWPPAAALTTLVVTAVGGTTLAALLAERTPKVG